MKKKNLAIILVLIMTFLSSLGQFMMKKASATFEFRFVSMITNHYLIIGIILYIVAFVVFFTALRWSELSIVYPLGAMAFVWVTLLSIFFLHEVVHLIDWFGILLIICGVAFVGGAHFAY